jgi:adenosylcobalamin-dependent ribonucleoside-triphosphate reductase
LSTTPFAFTEEQLAKYVGKKPPFGILGAPTYMRTYSRPIYNEEGKVERKEDFLDTIIRVNEGNVNLGINHDDPTATPEWAEESLHFMWNMAIMPPGRGYWMMGTEYATKRGGDAMNNCWYTAVRPQSYEHIEMFEDQEYIFSHPEKKMASYPFVFMFDRAMLGGGVGFGAQRRNIHQMPKVSAELELKIYLHPNHPDWERIKASEEWDRIKGFLTSDSTGIDPDQNYYFATDNREGWNISVRETIDAHFVKSRKTKPVVDLTIDLSRIRPYDAPIKGFGGTASGPLPLIAALIDINNILNAKVGKRITSEDALDMMNLLGRCVVAGNVRRTALIALGDHDDQDYVNAKNYLLVDPVMEKDPETGWGIWENNKWGRKVQRRKPFGQVVEEIIAEKLRVIEEAELEVSAMQRDEIGAQAEIEANDLFTLAWKQENHRWASNNSVYTNEVFKDHHFIAAGIIANGEPGVGNEWLMKNFGRIIDGFQEAIDKDAEGLNPCAEITLWNGEPCNLVEVVPVQCLRHGLDVERALILGAQYTYRITFAKYIWKETARVIAQNRRIGVSLTGMQDYFLEKYGHYAVKGFEVVDGVEDITKPIFHQEIVDELDRWYKIVVDTNKAQAKAMGAVESIKKTTVKPSGTVAKLPGVSSGIHWNYAPYMIQRIRFHETDPYLDVLRACGFPIEKAQKEPNAVVVEFPIMNAGADNPNFLGAGDVPLEVQFANQYLFAAYWADNAVSATLTFHHGKEEDKIQPLLEAYNNRIKSTSLLPYSGHGYVQAPWEPITKEEYDRRVAELVAKPEDIQHLFDLTVEPKEDMLDSECIGGACPTR